MSYAVRDKQEMLNTISHGLGVVLGIIGLIFLLIKDRNLTYYSTLSIWIFGISLIVLYASSTIYHFFINENLKKKARIFDHMSIFLLIAGTYTPICLITLEKSSGWTIFSIVWSIAALGIFMKIFLTGKVDKLSLLLYLVMGWLLIFDIKNVVHLMNNQALLFLILGGILYTVGTIFYIKDKMPYAHFIWHLFVLGGSVSHYVVVYSII
ncbi:hemolysin III family protein [Apibacter sp.]|uniref:PAQR family membrane homeostasis protein TrhA n=1 Tax=Apibacter sp. TaxID=2023709 RepID=UPI0025EA5A73|nr:hemolysin III family protein [Apibacter sp.]MCT6869712.1 hemolysin III family protein [Apibacter sp.]